MNWRGKALKAGWTAPLEPKLPRRSACATETCTACDTQFKEICPSCTTVVFICEGAYSRCGGCEFRAFCCHECGGLAVTGRLLDEHQRHGRQHALGRRP